MADKTLWFRHDVGTMNDIRMQKIMRKYGLAGIGIYWCLVEAMYTNDGKIFFSEIPDIAFMIHAEEEIVDRIANDSDIFESDEEGFWSNRVSNELYMQQEVSEKAKEAVNARWKNHKKSQDKTKKPDNSTPEKYDGNTDVIRPNNDRNTGVSEEEYVRNTQTDRQTDNTDRENIRNSSCPASSEKSADVETSPTSKVFIELPCIITSKTPKGLFAVTEDEILKYEQLYPALTIRQELRDMYGWLDSNPSRKKSNVPNFITNWLKKSQDKARSSGSQNMTPTGMPNSAMRSNEAFKGRTSTNFDF